MQAKHGVLWRLCTVGVGGDISVEAKRKGRVVSFISRLGTPKKVDLVNIHFVTTS